MKATLFAFSILAASVGSALAGEGSPDYFNLALASPATPVPAYARLLPDNGTMSGPETPNSLPVGATVDDAARRTSG